MLKMKEHLKRKNQAWLLDDTIAALTADLWISFM